MKTVTITDKSGQTSKWEAPKARTPKAAKASNGGRAALAHKLHAKGLRKAQALPKLREAGFRVTPSLLNRIWARFSSHAS